MKGIKKVSIVWPALLIICSFIFGNSITQTSAKIKYKKYYNVRFGYTIKYPARFTEASYPQNMDGVERWTKKGEARLIISGSYSVSGTADASLAYRIHNCSEKPHYSYYIGKDFIRESYQESGKNVYYYRFMDNDRILSFVVSYPSGQKSYYKKA